MKQKNYGLIALETHISKVLKPIFIQKSTQNFARKDNFLLIENLRKNWAKIVGESYFLFCEPKKISFEQSKTSPKSKEIKKANLTISAHNSSVAFVLQAISDNIIENIASYYGYKIIGEIRIIQEPRNLMIEAKSQNEKILRAEILKPEQQEFIDKSTQMFEDEGLKLILQQLAISILK